MKGPLLSPGLELEGQGPQPGPRGRTEAPDAQFLCPILTNTRPPARSDPAWACRLAEGGQPGCGLCGHTMEPAFLTEARPAHVPWAAWPAVRPGGPALGGVAASLTGRSGPWATAACAASPPTGPSHSVWGHQSLHPRACGDPVHSVPLPKLQKPNEHTTAPANPMIKTSI